MQGGGGGINLNDFQNPAINLIPNLTGWKTHRGGGQSFDFSTVKRNSNRNQGIANNQTQPVNGSSFLQKSSSKPVGSTFYKQNMNSTS